MPRLVNLVMEPELGSTLPQPKLPDQILPRRSIATPNPDPRMPPPVIGDKGVLLRPSAG